jgi:hypothetical protein
MWSANLMLFSRQQTAWRAGFWKAIAARGWLGRRGGLLSHRLRAQRPPATRRLRASPMPRGSAPAARRALAPRDLLEPPAGLTAPFLVAWFALSFPASLSLPGVRGIRESWVSLVRSDRGGGPVR